MKPRKVVLCVALAALAGCVDHGTGMGSENHEELTKELTKFPVDTQGYLDTFNKHFEAMSKLWPKSAKTVMEWLFSDDPRLQVAGLSFYRSDVDAGLQPAELDRVGKRIEQLYREGSCVDVRAAALSRLPICGRELAEQEATIVLKRGGAREGPLREEAFGIIMRMPKKRRTELFQQILLSNIYGSERVEKEPVWDVEDRMVTALYRDNAGMLVPYFVDRLRAKLLEYRLKQQRWQAAKWLDEVLKINLRKHQADTEWFVREAAADAIMSYYLMHKDRIDKGEPVPRFVLPKLPVPDTKAVAPD